MICPYCNENIADAAQFCPICGQKQPAPQAPVQQAPQAPVQPAPQAPVQQAPQAPQAPVQPAPQAPQAPAQPAPQAPQAPKPPVQPVPQAPQAPTQPAPQAPVQPAPQAPQAPTQPAPQAPQAPKPPVQPAPQAPQAPAQPAPQAPQAPTQPAPQAPVQPAPKPPAQPAPQAPQAPTQQAPKPPVTEAPKEPMEDTFSQYEEMDLPPVTQAVADTKSSSRLPLLLGVGVLAIGLAGGAYFYMANNTGSDLDLSPSPSVGDSTNTTVSHDPVTVVRQYVHFANRSDITTEVVLSYFSQGTWEETEANQVRYEGVLNGSEESILLDYTVDTATGDSSLHSFSINDVSLGQDATSRTTFFTQLFQLACSGMDTGETEISSFDLNAILFQVVRNSEVSPGSYLYYCDLADVLYPENTWAITALDEGNFHVEFQAFEEESTALSATVLVETQSATVTMVSFEENGTEYDLSQLANWAEETSEVFFGIMGGEDILPETPEAPLTPPAQVNMSESEMMALYTEEMARYQSGQQENWSPDDFRSAKLPETAAYYTDLNVAFVDLDGNGIKEMIVDNGQGVIVAIHSLSNSTGKYQPTLLLGDTFESSITVGNQGQIAHTTSTAFDSETSLYQVSADTLVELDSSTVTNWVEDVHTVSPMSQYLPSAPEEPKEESEATPEPGPEETTNVTVDLLSGNESNYGSVLRKVAQALSSDMDETLLKQDNLSLLYQDLELDDVGYAFLDLNGDGIDELVIGDRTDKTGAFLGLYCMVGNIPTLLCNASEEHQYILCSDGVISYRGPEAREINFTVGHGILLESTDERSFLSLTNAYTAVYSNISNFNEA